MFTSAFAPLIQYLHVLVCPDMHLPSDNKEQITAALLMFSSIYVLTDFPAGAGVPRQAPAE
jgi:hypothetical protein